MLKKLLYAIVLIIPMLVIGSCLYSIKKVDIKDFYRIQHDTIYVTDTVKVVDTVIVEKNNKYFSTYEDLILFVAYVKTQSNRLDDDNYAVMQTLMNRMDKEGCDWRTYFNTPSINHSRSIRLMRIGALARNIDFTNPKDKEMFKRAVSCSYGYNPLDIPKNVLYFESFPKSPNRGIFKKDSIWAKYRHKFYTGNIN